MPRILAIAGALAALLLAGHARATWSIVAVDPATREVGVAGASCIDGVEVIAGFVPGRGVVAAQALASSKGRDHAVKRLDQGEPPLAILEEIASQDWDPRPWHQIGGRGTRQYAIASLDGPRTASFTGERTTPWAGARVGDNVAVTGNMLVGAAVVDRALAAFETGPEGCSPDLADRLLAALLAGAKAGGDRRCVPELSALSAYLAVARPEDPPDTPSLSIYVPYDGFNELWLYPIRRFWPKRGTAEENPVRVLAERYGRTRPEACLADPLLP